MQKFVANNKLGPVVAFPAFGYQEVKSSQIYLHLSWCMAGKSRAIEVTTKDLGGSHNQCQRSPSGVEGTSWKIDNLQEVQRN